MDAMGKSGRGAMPRTLRDVGAASGLGAAAKAMGALAACGGVPSGADVALAAACMADGQGATAYDDAPDLGIYDAVFAREA